MLKIDFKPLIYRLVRRTLIFSVILFVGLIFCAQIPSCRFVYDVIFGLFENTIFNVSTHDVFLVSFCVWCEFLIVSIPFILLLEFIEQSYAFLEKVFDKTSHEQ